MHPHTHHPITLAETGSLTDYCLPLVDLYGPVHKGLRLVLTELLNRMARTDTSDCDATERAVDDLDGLLYLCERHAEHESRHLHRAVELRRAGGSAALSHDHEQQRLEVLSLRSLALGLSTADEAERPRLWRALQLRFSRFVGENLVHMANEEERLQRELERLYDAGELAAIHGALVGSIGPEEMQAFMQPMLRAASPSERAAMLAKMADPAPEPSAT